MRKIEVTLYRFEELSDRAKERARQWWREASAGDNDFAEYSVSEFADTLKACGFDVSTRRGTRTELAIYWALNPDDAGFDASWHASAVNVDALIADRPVTYVDSDGKQQRSEHNARLVAILERIKQFATERPESYGSVTSSRRGTGIGETEWRDDTCTNQECDCDNRARAFDELARDLAHYLAWSISKEYDYVSSDEYIDETLAANEYEFTADGERSG